ncbi:MAG TPA: MBL fold metallo-hydrolase [Rhizomicrobium sp.]|jgi:glyoxylase-like metal-dependent hydrolase (beta-lactamase superfamily II)
MGAEISAYFDAPTNTISYLVSDPSSGAAAVIDPVLDYVHANGRAWAASAQRILADIQAKELNVEWILETHAHADHLSAAPYIRAKTGAPIAIGAQIGKVQAHFAPLFACDDLSCAGTEFDRLLADGETLRLGTLDIEVLHTPGHTEACVSYRIGDAVFVGDTLFMPECGTARADFPGGDAATLYRSIRRILALPPETRLFMCHDYKSPERQEFAWETTVADQRERNIHIRDGVSEEAFVEMRTARDVTLAVPALLLPAIQVNIRAGRLPAAREGQRRFLQIPLTLAAELEGVDPGTA